MDNIAIKVENLSKHLFWDVEPNKLNFETDKNFIITRILEYGLIKDWQLIYKYYGINEIAKVMIDARDIDDKSISFISLLSKIPRENFLCYITKQSTPKHWSF